VSNKRSPFCIHGQWVSLSTALSTNKDGWRIHSGGLTHMRCRDGRWGWFGADLLEENNLFLLQQQGGEIAS